MAEPPGAPGVDPGTATAESIAVIRDSATGRLLQPARHDGGAVSATEFVAAVADLAERNGSTGWLAAAVNAAAHAVAGLGDAAERVWGADTGALVTACGDPAGRLARRGGKLRLTGRWESVTGAEFADWLLLSAQDGDSVVCVLVPRDVAQVDRHAGRRGLDAAGIGDVTVTDAAVDKNAVFVHTDDDPCAPGESGRLRLPAQVVAGAGQAAAVVGAACGVWRAHVGQVRRRLATSYGSEDTNELTSSAVLVAKAESDIDAARLQLVTSLDGTAPSAAAAQRQAVTRARNAADQLLGSGSRHALDATDPVARLWLDVLAGYRLAIRRIEEPTAGGAGLRGQLGQRPG
jgi:3-hydroxy-9,10-secoandrosta-1,3,5(10)-triene-9,17-dione monooxygenase